MYYNREIDFELSKLIEPKGELRWLFDYVKQNTELDFLIGSNNSKSWISVYRGLSRMVSITKYKRKTDKIKIDGAKAYKDIIPSLYGEKSINDDFQEDLETLINKIKTNDKFDRYYKNKQEGFYQTVLSRKYGINGTKNDKFVIIDKEAVVGFEDACEKECFFNKFKPTYKDFQEYLSVLNAKKYGANLKKKSVGNELDFLALDSEGNILLIEYKHGTNTSGIYLSPIQIGMYYEIFTKYSREEFDNVILKMLKQKQRIGLINPDWKIPSQFKNIIPILIISDYQSKSSAKKRFDEVLPLFNRKMGTKILKNLKTWNYNIDTKKLENWK